MKKNTRKVASRATTSKRPLAKRSRPASQAAPTKKSAPTQPKKSYILLGTDEYAKPKAARFTGEDPALLAKAADLFGVSTKDNEALALQVPSDGTVSSLRAVLDRLDAASVDVEALTVHAPDLDDVFLSLTGHAAEDETETGDAAKAGARAGGA